MSPRLFLKRLSRIVLILVMAGAAINAVAQERERPGRRNAAPQAAVGSVLRLLPPDSVREHTISIGGRDIAYTSTAGTLSLFNQSGERSAAVFYTAYVAKDAGGAQRPLTFVFNGGPGAASAYLHLGLVGPKIVTFGPNGNDGAAAKLVDNPDSWIAFTDLVLIDPIGTGWSRTAKADDAKSFWGVQADAESLAKVIALYVNKNNRNDAPKYLLGESYGGFRAAKVARTLQSEQGIIASGIIMVSPMIEGAFQYGGNRFALGAALHLPSLVAAELERKKAFTPQALAEAERFAMTDYLTTLAGPPPREDAARRFYARVAQMTGLPEDVVAKARGFVRNAYVKNLRANDGKIVSSYDATFASDDPFPGPESARTPDPMLDGMLRAYGGAFVTYARDQLGYTTEMTYHLLNSDVSGAWNWRGRGRFSQPSATNDLSILLALHPAFRLMVTHGYTDLVTPYGVSRYVLDHLPPLSGPPRAELKLYRGGHMFYVDAASRHAFTADAAAFYRGPIGRPQL
jgi:carboxypeptidase C (cathepsin A)